MDNVLEFKKSKEKEVTPSDRNLIIGNWRFTCAYCDRTHYIECPSIIFRTLEFFCKCGKYHRVTNPAFSRNK